jgi:antirestriction protein ArdC
VFWKWLERKVADGTTGKTRTERVPMLRYYSVFNADQCEDLAHPLLDAERLLAPLERSEFERIAAAEALFEGFEGRPPVRHGGNRACYSPSLDQVEMPACEAFESVESYYSVLFHELTHSTGHRSRLDRDTLRDVARFADHSYSREELVAEMGASFLRAVAGIESEPMDENSAAYLRAWIKKLKGDSRLVVVAAAQAQKAADWVRGERAVVCE